MPAPCRRWVLRRRPWAASGMAELVRLIDQAPDSWPREANSARKQSVTQPSLNRYSTALIAVKLPPGVEPARQLTTEISSARSNAAFM
jgi:hypothetical protein